MINKRSTILLIGPKPPPYNGVSVVTSMVLTSDICTKFNVLHVDTGGKKSIANIGRFDWTNMFLVIKHYLNFIWIIILKRPHIIYMPISQSTPGYLRDSFFLCVAKVFRNKVVIHLHGGYFKDYYHRLNSIMKWWIKWTLADVARVIVLGKCLVHIFQGFVNYNKIMVIPNGIDFELEHKKKTQYRTNQKKVFNILFQSTIRKHRGVLDIINAIPLVLKAVQDVKFIFAGEFYIRGSERNEIYDLIKSNNLGTFVKFPGVILGKKKEDFFSEADVFVFPSYNEGQPLSILEAMAAGLPVITTDTGAICETIVDGENGFIVDRKNPKQIADRIIYLINDDELREKIGNNNRKKFLQHYTKKRFLQELCHVFDDVSRQI